MIVFYIITSAVLTALAFVFWLIWKEQNAEESPKREEDKVSAASLLDRLGLEPGKKASKTPSKTPSFLSSMFSSKKNITVEEIPPEEIKELQAGIPKSGTAALRLDNQDIEKEVSQSIKNDELQKEIAGLIEKTEKLEQILSEKNQDLEKITKEIEHEQRHRKEFNKIKDLLEKELKEKKEEARKFETELNSVKSEGKTYLTRISQLEEKIKSLEKNIQEKDDAIVEHLKQIDSLKKSASQEQPEDQTSSMKEPIPEETNPEETAPEETTAEKTTPEQITPEETVTEQIPMEEPTIIEKTNPPVSCQDNIEPQAQEDPLPLEKTCTETSPENINTENPLNTDANIEDSTESVEKTETPIEAVVENNPITTEHKEFSSPLDLNPVSNLEENYDQEAAPKTSFEKNLATDRLETDNETETAGQSVDDFLKEHLTADTVSSEEPQVLTDNAEINEKTQLETSGSGQLLETEEISEASNAGQKLEENLATSQESPEPESMTKPENIEENKNQDPGIIEESTKSNEFDNKLSEEEEEEEEESDEKNRVHLRPDIFKDIEEQFRKIEQEMNFTQQEETINIQEQPDEQPYQPDQNQQLDEETNPELKPENDPQTDT